MPWQNIAFFDKTSPNSTSGNCYNEGMNNDLHTTATVLTYYLLDNDFCAQLAKENTFRPYFSEGIDALVSRMEALLEGMEPELVNLMRNRAAFYESLVD